MVHITTECFSSGVIKLQQNFSTTVPIMGAAIPGSCNGSKIDQLTMAPASCLGSTKKGDANTLAITSGLEIASSIASESAAAPTAMASNYSKSSQIQ